jgi:hypothetical protein
MNYITHLNKTFAIFCEDERLTPFHVSLYYSLFQYWNMARFRNPISISRDELMRASKIGSVNTYIRCIKELDKWAYIKYMPSYNPQKGSQVYLYNFNNSNDNSNNNGSDIPDNKSIDKTLNKADDKTSEKPMIPSINNSNNINISNSLNEVSQQQHNNSNIFSDDNSKSNFKRQGTKKEKSSAKKEKGLSNRSESRCVRPLLEELKIYFTQNKSQHIEAEKFYNHYESNGWLVGGKTPMKNWKASVNNWILNSVKFSNGKANSSNNKASNRAGQLHTATGKDYSEPL